MRLYVGMSIINLDKKRVVTLKKKLPGGKWRVSRNYGKKSDIVT